MLERLISEIANLLQMSEEQVRLSFSQDQLNRLLDESKCEDPGVISNFIDSLEVPCQDTGSQFDPTLEQDEIEDPIIEEPINPSECQGAVEQVNREIKDQTEEYNNVNILLNKLIEFQDHIKIVGYYYEERVKRVASVLNDYRPLLVQSNQLESEIIELESRIDSANNAIITAQSDQLRGSISYEEYLDIRESYSILISSLQIESREASNKLVEVQRQIDLKADNYSVLNTSNPTRITGLSPNSTSTQISQFNQEANRYIDVVEVVKLLDELQNYSEYINLTSFILNAKTYEGVISSPLLKFEIKLQGLNSMQIEKEVYNEETGESSTFNIDFPIAESPLLLNNSFKDGFLGCEIKDVEPKETSSGVLYTEYYNKLSNPFEEMFTLEDRGLTSNISQLDPALQGSDNITKRENGKDYYIKDLNKMNSFYGNFEATFESKKESLRAKVKGLAETNIKQLLTKLAIKDVDVLLASGGFYTNLVEDNSNLRKVVDKINEANTRYLETLGSLNSEIDRLRTRLSELKPSPEKVKERLKQLNSKCFGDEPEPEPECQDVKDRLGSDPLYLDQVDGSLPNFTQLCYWKEFSKVANIMGLAPIPNSPIEFRYWPVGLIIPTPALPVKVPLPIVWIPLVCISSPLGVFVIFLTINGIFISPIIFFISSSGHKQHILTVRGPSPKLGSDQFDDVIKPTIKIPVAAKAAKDAAARLASGIQVPQADLDRLESYKQKRAELEATGDLDAVRRVEDRIAKLEKKKEDLGKGSSEILKDILDSRESAKNDLEKIKSDIVKKINTIGRPLTNSVERLKEKAAERTSELRLELVEALESNDLKRAKRIRSLLKDDGLDLNEKIQAITDDILDYFDNLDLPKFTIPKEESKINPLPSFGGRLKADIEDKKSKLNTRIFSKKDKSIKNILKMDLAKYRKEIDLDLGDVTVDLNLDDASDRVADLMSRALESVIKFSTKAENRPAIGFKPETIAILSSLKLDLNPFAPCCSKPAVEIDLGPTAAVIALFNSAIPLITNYVKGLDPNRLKSMFGGKQTISSRDIRTSLVSMINLNVPDSIEVPIPEFGLSQSIVASSAVLSSIQIPQAPFPPEVKAFSAPGQISVDLNTIIKTPLTGALKQYLEKNVSSFPRDLDLDFVNMSGSDLKQILIRFLDLKFAEIEPLLNPIYAALAFSKSAKGSDLNILEKTVHSLPVYGTVIEKIFSVKTLVKMNLPGSAAYSLIDLDALEQASALLEPLLSPIVKSPVGYFIVAGAAVTGNLDLIRKIHPILNFDDIPAWERLTVSNVMLLLFLDEFIYEAANKVGLFRQYI